MAKSYTVPEVGDEIAGRYRIEEEIGRGGFGVVYRAVQLGMQREVAIKTLLPAAMAQQEMIERFRREAVLARNLNHPNTIRLYDFGDTGGGTLYIAMEFLDGIPLEKLIKQGPLQAERVQRIGAQILKSLAEAHQHAVIHRDLKPANVFIVNVVGEEDFVKVLDFGIAKAFGQEASDGKLTQTGIGFGTPRYMAPEQVRGKAVCPATDLYALGLLMTECLTGDVVYNGDSSMDVAMAQLSEAPPPIPEWVLRGALGPVIQRATQKDMRLRYPSAAEMLRDLKNIDTHASIDISSRLPTGQLNEMMPEEGEEKKTGLPLLIALAAAVTFFLIAVAAAAIVFGLAITGEPEGAVAKTPPAMEPVKPVKPEPKEPAKPATIQVELSSTPPGATVYDGDEFLASLPATVSFDRKEGKLELLAKLEGFEDRTLSVDLAEDGTYNIELEVDVSDLKGAKKTGRNTTNAAISNSNRKNGSGNTTSRKKPAGSGKNGDKKTGTGTKRTEKRPEKVLIPKL